MTNDGSSQRSARDTQFFRAIAWTGIGKYAGQALRWGTTFIVARVLSPSDYGLVGMTGLFSGLVYLLSEFGVGTAVIKQRDLDESSLAKLNGLAAATGIAAALVGWAAAGPLARFFGQPEIQNIVRVSSIGFLLGSMQSIRSAILQRDMRFKTLASIEFTNAVLVAALVLVGALMGLGYWSLVLPSLVASTVSLVWLCTLVSVPIAFPDLRLIPEAARFSAWVFLGRVGSYLFATSDFLVVGRVLGDSALGSYQFAWGLANTPNDQVNGLVARVSGPFYSSVQTDRKEIARLYSSLLSTVALLSVPLVLGLAAVAPEFIAAMLGPQWGSAVLPLQILCVLNTVRIIPILAAPVLQMVGEVRFQAVTSFVGLSYMPIAFYFGAKNYGATGVAAAWLLGYPALLFLIARRTGLRLGLGFREYFVAMLPAITSGAAMVGAVSLLRLALPHDLVLLVKLLCLIVAGALTYAAVLLLVFPAKVKGVVTTMGVLFARKPPAAVATSPIVK
jgi:O-antigen/teichoic acid export membrane protein